MNPRDMINKLANLEAQVRELQERIEQIIKGQEKRSPGRPPKNERSRNPERD